MWTHLLGEKRARTRKEIWAPYQRAIVLTVGDSPQSRLLWEK